ncbi:MAG: hypothetical protein ABUL60_30150 [Myxococcales bacterium]
MTGGRRRPEEYGPLPFPPPVLAAKTPDELATLAALDRFKRAMGFRRELQQALRPLGISFAEWRLLEASSRLIRQTGEPVSHLEVSRELDVSEGCVSRLMWQLAGRGLVDHDLDGLGLQYRVLVTNESEGLVAEGYVLAAAVENRRR